jgi:hypothetical protein
MVMKNLPGGARGVGGITGGGARNVSKVNQNGAAAPATPSTKKTAKKKKMTAEEGIAADLNAFLNFNAGR